MNTQSPRKDTISSSEHENELNPNIAVIKFQCLYETRFGQQLHIIGNIEELGLGNEEKAPAMSTDQDLYPIWETTFEITCPVGMTIEYNYFIKGDLLMENNTNVSTTAKTEIKIDPRPFPGDMKTDITTSIRLAETISSFFSGIFKDYSGYQTAFRASKPRRIRYFLDCFQIPDQRSLFFFLI